MTQRFKLRLVNQAGEQLPTKVEFSRRETVDPFCQALVPPAVSARYHRVAFRCQHYPGPSAACQKLRALAGRPVTQARDLFDLFILYAADHLRDIATRPLGSAVLERAKSRLGEVSYAQYRDQVVAYLAKEARPAYEEAAVFAQIQQSLLAPLP